MIPLAMPLKMKLYYVEKPLQQAGGFFTIEAVVGLPAG